MNKLLSKGIITGIVGIACIIPFGLQKEKTEFITERINYASEASDAGFADENLYNCIKEDDEFGGGINTISNLSCINKSITSLSGIEQLTNLQELNVGGNELTSIDLSGNTKLRWLEASHNQITSVKFPQSMQTFVLNDNKLSTLDLREYKNLVSVEVEDNELTDLNVFGISTLSRLELKNNQLETLNISKTALSYIAVVPSTYLKHLYASSMSNMQQFYIGGYTNLEDIDISFSKFESGSSLNNLTKLKKITASVDKIKTLDFSLYPNLEKVVATKTDTVTVNGTSISTSDLLKYIPSNINTSNGYKFYLNKIDNSTVYTKSSFSGNAGTEVIAILTVDGTNSDVKGFSGTQEFHEWFRLKFTNASSSSSSTSSTTNNPKTGIKEIKLISLILACTILAVSFIKIKKKDMFKNF